MKRYILLLTIAICYGCATQPSGTSETTTGDVIVDDQVRARIDSVLRSFVDEGRVAGASALIYEKDKEVYYNAFGFADRESQTPMERNTIVRIYSMTKPITGVALMKLYEEGKFQLDDPLEKYAPEFSDMKVVTGADVSGNPVLVPASRPITIRDLTRHTAGFVNNQPPPALEKLVRETDVMSFDNNLSTMAERLGKLPLMFHPGEQWSYGLCVDVQAFLVERISGKPFDQYLKENILVPLGMETTGYFVPEANRNQFAALYRREDNQLVRVPEDPEKSFNLREWPLKPGGFGLTSTLDDYMRFARMLVNEGKLDGVQVLEEKTVNLMATNHLSDSIEQRMWLPSKGQVGFGIDFAVRLRPPANEKENHGIVGEFFWDGAASTLFWVDPVNELAAVLFVQIMPFDGQVHKRFRDAVYGPYVPEQKSALVE